jgi:O-antigen ligase
MLIGNTLSYIIKLIFYFFPISFILGSLIVNLNTLLFILTAPIFIYLNKIKIKFNFTNLTLLAFFFICILSSLINLETIGSDNFLKSVFLIRFYILYILIETLILNRKLEIKYFFHICLAIIIFLSIDLIIQFIYGKNILGYEPWEGRITGIFEHEAIAGSFLQKIFVFSLISIFLIRYSNIVKKNIFQIIYFLIVIFASFVASNRVSFFMLSINIFILIAFFSLFRRSLILTLIILLPIFYYSYQVDFQTNYKYKNFFDTIIKTLNFEKNNLENNKIVENSNLELNSNKELSDHTKLFYTSFLSFKESPFLGNGLKSFRYNCRNFLDKQNTQCSTHPHNYHLEILHDAGILGFILILIFAISLMMMIIKNIKTENNQSHKIISGLLFINFFITIFPFQSTGSIFTSWNGTLIWLILGILNYSNIKNVK